MTDNRYAPPTAKVADMPSGEVAPALWNPNAAANWSFLFTPAFGAFVQMKNWQALEEPEKAAASKRWAIASLVIIFGSSLATSLVPTLMPLNGVSRILGFALLITWYFSSGRKQAEYVKSRFGQDYERRGWGKPLLIALLAFVALIVVVVVVAVIAASIE
jgi:hypothetical protein